MCIEALGYLLLYAIKSTTTDKEDISCIDMDIILIRVLSSSLWRNVDHCSFQKFQQAQGELSGALSRLMVVAERYPTLQANQGFRDLRVTLEGTENRVTVARNRYIEAVQQYNVLARSFPTNLTAMAFSYAPKPSFTVQNEAQISTPPAVDFSK